MKEYRLLDYKDIIIKHYSLMLDGTKTARQIGATRSGVNGFLSAFEARENLAFPFQKVSQTTVFTVLFMAAASRG